MAIQELMKDKFEVKLDYREFKHRILVKLLKNKTILHRDDKSEKAKISDEDKNHVLLNFSSVAKDGKEQKQSKECYARRIVTKKGKKHQKDSANANCLFVWII